MKKPKRSRCTTHKKFRFKKNKEGSITRTCTKCGYKITDLASGKFGTPVTPMKGRYKKKKDREVKPPETL